MASVAIDARPRTATPEGAIAVAALVAILAAGTWLAFVLGPEPHSDWAYYWQAAGDLSQYRRGGLDLWLLWIPKAMGLSPVAAALTINLPAAAVVFLVAWSAGRGLRWPALLAIGYLALLTPYLGIVQLDLIAAAQIAAAFWLWFRGGRLSWTIAVILMAMAVSTKPQYALTLWAMLALLAPVAWLRDRVRVLPLLAMLAAGSVAGFGIDVGLRHASGNSEAIRTTSAVTLYGGLLVSGTGVGCGAWSVEAGEAAKADLGQPLATAIVERLRAKPASHWWNVMRCKLPDIVVPYPYAVYWLVESPNVRARIDASPDRERQQARYLRALDVERRLHGALVVLILGSVLVSSVLLARRREWSLAAVPVAWVLSFWGVHLVFEIQGRYFLGLLLLAPIICAFVLRHATRSRSATALQQPHIFKPSERIQR